MKFIVDAHLPKKLSLLISWKGYDCLHTLDLPNQNRTKDSEINQFSLDEKRVLISKDLDFIESLLISDKPYKLLYISTGNISNKMLLDIFTHNIKKIVELLEENRVVELTKDSIVVKG